jgi:hypothetical protein
MGKGYLSDYGVGFMTEESEFDSWQRQGCIIASPHCPDVLRPPPTQLSRAYVCVPISSGISVLVVFRLSAIL